jgi:Secretion system C-terminal sorting domain
MKLKQTLTLLCTFTYFICSAQLIDEEFEALTFPAGWVGPLVALSKNNACAGSTQSLAFSDQNETLITPLLVDPLDIKFLYKRSGNTAAWTLIVEYSTSIVGTWTFLGTISNATNTECTVFSTDLSTLSNIYIRLRDARPSVGSAERYIDNVVVNQRAPLSVSFLDFKAQASENTIKLDWSTANETQNSHFIVERSRDGKNFDAVGQVKGNGTSTQTTQYTFIDLERLNTGAYYRLRQVDLDGKMALSKVISVRNDFRKNNVKVYPTLVNDLVTIELNTSENVEIEIRDIVGRIVLSQKVKNTELSHPNAFNTEGVKTYTFNMSDTAKGMYFIAIKSLDNNEIVKIQKF